MSKAAKGIILLDYLTEGKKTRKQIAQRLEISERSVMRLIDELSVDFIIESIGGRGGGYYLPQRTALRGGFLTKHETALILEALSAYRGADSTLAQDVSLKLRGLSHKINEWLIVDFSKWDSSDGNDNTFDDIKNAILETRQIEFTYFDRSTS